MPYFDAKDFPQNMPAIWRRHFGHLATSGATVVVGEWGGFFRGKDRQWQESFARYLKDNRLSSFYWSLNPNSEDTGGLLTSTWSEPESGKLALLQGLPSTSMVNWLRTRQAFDCPPTSTSIFHRCGSSEKCVLKAQVCNGVPECHDRSDEQMCTGIKRPCTTVSGQRAPCIFPFMYNGYQYDRCILIDSEEEWKSIGVGRCQSGFMASMALHGVTLEACQAACSRSTSCELVSYTSSEGGFCGGYTASCAQQPLTTGVTGYHTYRHNDQGGAWCATRTDEHGAYMGGGWDGRCGPACDKPTAFNEPKRSRCQDNGAYSDGGPAHCSLSSPPPPMPPPPPLPPPPQYPPHWPPALPPPLLSFLDPIVALDDWVLLTFMVACTMLCVCACICCARARQAHWSEKMHHRCGQPAFRHLDHHELQALASDADTVPSRHRKPTKSSNSRHHGRRC